MSFAKICKFVICTAVQHLVTVCFCARYKSAFTLHYITVDKTECKSFSFIIFLKNYLKLMTVDFVFLHYFELLDNASSVYIQFDCIVSSL